MIKIDINLKDAAQDRREFMLPLVLFAIPPVYLLISLLTVLVGALGCFMYILVLVELLLL